MSSYGKQTPGGMSVVLYGRLNRFHAGVLMGLSSRKLSMRLRRLGYRLFVDTCRFNTGLHNLL